MTTIYNGGMWVHVRKTIVFDGTPGHGEAGTPIIAFVATGTYQLRQLAGSVTVDGVGAGNITIGTASAPNAFCVATDAVDLVANSFITPGSAGVPNVINDFLFSDIANGGADLMRSNIIITPAGGNIDEGTIILDAWYVKISDNGALVGDVIVDDDTGGIVYTGAVTQLIIEGGRIHVRKTIVLDGTPGNGGAGVLPLFTTTGRVSLLKMVPHGTALVGTDSAALIFGITSDHGAISTQTGLLNGQTGFLIGAGQVGLPDGPDLVTIGQGSWTAASGSNISIAENIVATVLDGNLSGLLVVDAWYEKITDNGALSGTVIVDTGVQDFLNDIAETLFKFDLSTITGESARSMLNALRFLRNKWTIVDGTLTVTKENDTTTAWTAAVTRSVANPVSAVDPA